MNNEALRSCLLRKNDLAEDFNEEPPSAALGPKFVSGDEAGRQVVDLTNLFAEGKDPANLGTAYVMYGDPTGAFIFNNVGSFSSERAKSLFDDFSTAVAGTQNYIMELSDGVQVVINRGGMEPVDVGDEAHKVEWVSSVAEYRIETAWILARVGDVLTLVNSRLPDSLDLQKLAGISVDRLRKLADHIE